MKLILKEYLASLREREELDAILPDLLSQMGLNVIISPTRGVPEYGVDIAAVGSFKGKEEKVYLFSVKSGDLTRAHWDSGDQALRPSLNDIKDVFIENRIPEQHKDKPIVIGICFGGDMPSSMVDRVVSYTKSNTTKCIAYEIWNGDVLASFVSEYLLSGSLLPWDRQSSLMRKSLALIEEPIVSSRHFCELVRLILENDTDKKIVKSLIQLNLVLWIFFSWCRDEENLEAAYISAEYSLLLAWDSAKKFPRKTTVKSAFENFLKTYHTISDAYLEKSIFPFVDKKHAISQLVSAPCSISINLKLFDILGRLTIKGQWLLFELSELYKKDVSKKYESEEQKAIKKQLRKVKGAINQLVINNPLLLSPYKDEHAIELAMALHLLYQDNNDDGFAESWLDAVVDRVTFSFITNGMYPTNLHSYEQLLEHRNKDKTDSSYKESVTKASILYPTLTILCELYGREEAAKQLEGFSSEHLKHCTLQYWYPNEASEEHVFSGTDQHGVATTDFPINGKAALEHVEEESQYSNFFWELSAVKQGYLPLVLMACRHYRYPVPFNLLFPERLKANNREVDKT
ncbi:hypothetical protein B6N13_06975 [Marinomonas sp. UCMA 3892]|uniref:hypothetical protein n=1 Tax=Marinomonas sp. UCMA 3892 TaxID=1972585 RepID=UPI00146A3839|nr:hypothetical protein [Marinomonas sp. UCMA 3892]NLU97844.1 hypothetical protein [Marinomonas sp. UCMA 3892]